MPGKNRLVNRVAVVTGASSGLGRAISLAYSDEGAKVVCADIRPTPRLEAASEATERPTHEEIVARGGNAIYVKCDVGESKEVEDLIAETVRNFDRVDIMVNNAGIAVQLGPVHETPEADFDRTLHINSRGTFLGCKYAARQMLTQDKLNANGDRGWIINIASIYGVSALGGIVSYTTSKHAVSGITKSAALDYASSGIHVNAICPSWIDTAMVGSALQTQLGDALLARHPWGRLGKLEDITGPAIFLASDEASFITGILLMVDGGLTVQ